MAEKGLFLQNVVAIIWDFDKTLSPQYMQTPIFEEYGVDEATFWKEVNALPAYYARAGIQVHEDTSYLSHLLSYVQHGRMPDLSNAKLRELGARIDLFPGLPDAFDRLKGILDEAKYAGDELRLEHYVVSTGLYAMIEGSQIADKLDGIWASAFIEEPAAPGADFGATPKSQPITQIAGFLDNTTKTRAIFEINKGVNKEASISVNDTVNEEDRRVPFKNMIYVADGPSDVPSFSVVKKHGGLTCAVHDEETEESYKKAMDLHDTNRVDFFGPANYEEKSPTDRWLGAKIRQIADLMLKERSQAIESRVQRGPAHLAETKED